jgi:hypothetical protein
VSSIVSFEAYVDDYAVNLDLAALVASDKSQLDGSVASGKKMTGAIAFQVPVAWSEIEVRYTPNFWGGKDIVFVANK